MKIGVFALMTEAMLRVGELAVELEAAGIELLWAGEHSHIPVSRDTERVSGGELPEYYARLPDPFVTLAVAAAVTTELKLGTNVCLVTQRDPIQLAEEGRDARPRVRRPLLVRRRRRLEPGDAKPGT